MFLKQYISFFLFALTLLWLFKVLLLSGYPDFTGYYFGAKHIVHGDSPYDPDSSYFTPQSYPPFTIILFSPFSFLSFQAASKLWVVFSIACIIYVIYLLSKIYKISFFSPSNLFISSLIFISFPVKFTLGMGQINPLILLFMAIGFYLFNLKKDSYAGIFFAFSIMVKFFPILLLPYFIFSKKWKIMAIFVVAITAFMSVSFLVVSASTVLYYFQHLLPDLLFSWKGDYYNQSLTGFLMREIHDSSLRELLRFIIPLILVFINFFLIITKKTKNTSRINLEIASLITLSVLINNFSWQHHFIFLILPFFIVFYTLRKKQGNIFTYCILGLSYILIALNFKNPYALPLLLQNHVFFGGIILWAISIYSLLRYKIS